LREGVVSRWRFLLFAAVVAVLIAADPAFAAEQADNSLDKITNLFKTGARRWEEVLGRLAMQLFVILAAIELGWSAVKLALKGADFGEWLADFLNQILFIGFFYMLLQHSSEWAGFIVDSFRQAADRSVTMANAHAASMNEHIAVTPSNLFDMGMNLAGHIFEQVSITTPIANVGIDIAALLVLIAFALIAAFMITALVESYIVISAGVLLMGFGGSRWTKDYAVKTFVYAVSVGAKLFIIQLLAGTAYAQFQTLRTSFSSSLTDTFVILGAVVVLLALIKTIPDMVQGLINGTSPGGEGGLVAVGRQAMHATAAVASMATGAGMVAVAATKLASEQIAQDEAEGQGPRSRAGRFARMAGYAAGNVQNAAFGNFAARLRGEAPFGTRLGQMAVHLERQAGEAAAERQRPEDPAPSGGGPRPGAPGAVIRGGGRVPPEGRKP
jgi:type IV secretion system protein TrbL